MDKYILLTGGSHAELPLIDALHRLGFKVVSTGLDEGNLGHLKTDAYEKVDFSDKDAVLEVAEKYDVFGCVSGCNDFAYLSTAHVCEKLGLPGHDPLITAEQIHHKSKFRSLCQRTGVRFPEFFSCREIEDRKEACKNTGYPLVVKAIDLTGGKGVTVCRDFDEVKTAFEMSKKITRQEEVIIEKYVEGENHGVSALICKGRVVFAFFDNEEYYINKYLVSGAYGPSDLSDETKSMVIDDINRLFRALPMKDGLFHCQCIVDKDGIPYLIDPCRRSPGDLYIKLVEYSTGIDYGMMIVKSELGMDISEDLKDFRSKDDCIARECLMTDRNGVLKDICISDEYRKYIIDELIWASKGDIVRDLTHFKAGIVILRFPDRDTMKEKIKDFRKNIYVEVEADEN